MEAAMEASMGTLILRQKFDPFDLELIDRVYGVACAYIEARDLYRDTERDAQEEDALRKTMFSCAGTGPLDFDNLCDRVLASMEDYRTSSRAS
jgi:hypothetical protein